MVAPVTVTAEYMAEYLLKVSTTPEGIPVNIDGADVGTLYEAWQPAGLTVSFVAADTMPSAGRRYFFVGWSDGGDRAHSIAIAGPIILIAEFKAQFHVALDVTPSGAYLRIDGLEIRARTEWWWDAGSHHAIEAPTPQVSGNSRLVLADWLDGVNGSQGTVIDTPLNITAHFVWEHALTLSSDPPDAEVLVDGQSYALPVTLWLRENSSYLLAAPQIFVRGALDFRFVAWSDGGPQIRNEAVRGPLDLRVTYGPVPATVQNPESPWWGLALVAVASGLGLVVYWQRNRHARREREAPPSDAGERRDS